MPIAAVTGTGAEDKSYSLFEVGSTLIRFRWPIVSLVSVGGVVGLLIAVVPHTTYTATSSFVSQGTQDVGQGGLRNLAVQFGVSLAGATQTQLPQFYADLLKSRAVLGEILADTLVVTEQGNRRVALTELLGATATDTAVRAEEGLKELDSWVKSKTTPRTGVLTVMVTSPWRSVSLHVTSRVIEEIDKFNSRTRQVQATAERKFTEERLAEARTTLRNAEDRLQAFLQTNRQLANSPQLALGLDRLRSEVALQQQVVGSLATTLEDVRIREVRNTPIITVLESPAVPTKPDPRRRLLHFALGLLAGGAVGALLSLLLDAIRRGRAEGGPEAETFFAGLTQMRGEITALFGRSRRRSGGA